MDRTDGRIRLALPTIDLLECKKFKGGYHEESIYDTDNYYPEEGDSAIYGGEIDPAIVYGDSTDDNYCREDDFDRDDNWDDNQNEYDQHEVNRPETVEDDSGDTPLIVKVDDGQCSIGTFAAAIQVIYNEIASKAILKAETAMKNAGIDLEVDPSTNTIDFAWGQYSNALGNYFNITDFKSLPPDSRYEKLEEVFNEGGCGILMDETHMVCAVEYENGIFTYYDSTTGQYDTGYAGEFKELILLERK